MARPRKDVNQLQSARISICLTEQEREALEARARDEGMSVGALVRGIIKGWVNTKVCRCSDSDHGCDNE